MKTLRTIALASLLFSLHAQAEDTLIDLNLENADAGSPPPVERFQLGIVNHSFEKILADDNNRLEVVKDVPNFPGKAVRYIKGSSEPRTPNGIFVNNPTLATTGKFRFSWEASLDSYTSGEKFPGFESLLTFSLLDKFGKVFFNFYYLIGRDESSGVFGTGNIKLGTWVANQKQQFEVIIDLDNKTAEIKVDGEQLGEPRPLIPFEGLRVVQFTDGVGFAFYGGQFNATIANFKMVQL